MRVGTHLGHCHRTVIVIIVKVYYFESQIKCQSRVHTIDILYNHIKVYSKIEPRTLLIINKSINFYIHKEPITLPFTNVHNNSTHLINLSR